MRPYGTGEYSLKRPRREAFPWAVAGLIVIGLALRLYRLGSQSLWIDEVLTFGDAGLIYQEHTFLGSLLRNLHGPLYSLVFYGTWQLSGLNEFWLRFPSAVAGTVTLGAMYALASAVYDRHTAWWAVLLLALSPFHIWYSQEARNYSFVVLFVTLSMLFLHRFVTGGTARSWVNYVWTTAAALLSNLSCFLLLAAQGAIALVGGGSRRRLWSLLPAGLVLILILLPWLLEFNNRMDPGRALHGAPVAEEELLRGDTTFTPWGIPFTFFVFGLGYSAGPSLRELHMQSALSAVAGEWAVVGLGALVFGLVAALGAWKTREDRRTLVGLLLYILVPMLVLSFLAVRNIKVFNARYVMVALPAYYLLLARGLSQVGRAWLRWMNLSLVLLLVLYSLSNYYFDPRYAKEDIRSAVDYVQEHAADDDIILMTNCRSVFDLYYAGRPQVLDILDLLDQDPLITEENLKQLATIHPRLWLVQVREWDVDPHGALEKLLMSRFGLVDKQIFPGVRLSAFDLSPLQQESR
ncbi:MAG: glycosyltransferase family 39 protein [Candidatus Eisenbacteria sp.]|nr:glycosyltransferase family 39 protein [Candidatus Eisenbacteria bacterium]